MVNIKFYLVVFGRGAMLALGFMSWKVPFWHYAWRVPLWHDLLWDITWLDFRKVFNYISH